LICVLPIQAFSGSLLFSAEHTLREPLQGESSFKSEYVQMVTVEIASCGDQKSIVDGAMGTRESRTRELKLN